MQFFSVCLKSHRNLRSTIICDSAVVNLVISSSPQSSLHFHHHFCPILWTLWWWWVHCLMTHKEILINKQVRHIVKRIRKIVVHVELCKEIEKDVFLSCRAWESPWGIKPDRPLDSVLWRSTTEPQRLYGEQGTFQSPNMTYVLHNARIGNVVKVLCFVNRIRWYVLSLVKKKRKKLFCLVASMGQRKNYKTPCYCVSITICNGSHGRHSLSDCKPWLIKIYLNSFVSNHYLVLGVTDLWSWLKVLKIFCINSCLKLILSKSNTCLFRTS